MILDCNASKGGVDIFDQNMEEFSCRGKTLRWPLLFFFNILDAAANNAYILMQKNGYRSSRKDFLKKLTLDLATPLIQSRLCKSKVRILCGKQQLKWVYQHLLQSEDCSIP